MKDQEKQILTTFKKVLPKLNEKQKDHLLSFGEGIAFKIAQEEEAEKGERDLPA